jgi:hypothetical protein
MVLSTVPSATHSLRSNWQQRAAKVAQRT